MLTHEIVSAGELETGHDDVARLMYLAATEYYDLLGLPEARTCAVIAELVGREGTDLETVFVARGDDRILGAYAAVDSDALRAASGASARHFMQSLDRDAMTCFINAAREQQLPDVPAGTLHLVRIAVFPQFRGQGLADALMSHFIVRGAGGPLSIHVRSPNAGAIAVYERHGFERGDERSGYVVMERGTK